jgi:chloramphenicol 3-O-phosphotransferase
MHTQLLKTLSHPMPPAPGAILDSDHDTALLEFLGDLSNTHAVVLGEGALEFMCALLRRNCIAATAMRWNEKVEAEIADLVVVPHVACLKVVEQALWQARRAMLPNGRIVLRVENDRTGWMAFSAARLLRTQGFASIRVRPLPH